MRNAFIEELLDLAETNPRVALVVGDLGFGVVEAFARKFPDRFFNAGVAEQNMMGLAAGLASEGFHVFVYSIANFPTFRCAEQIRNDVDYHNLPVTVVSVGGGVAYGNLGYSHHAVQDYALIRTMPNMLIAAPGDPMEVRACARYLVEHPQPSYLRLGKAGEPCVHGEVPKVLPGVWLPVCHVDGSSSTYLSTGGGLSVALGWRQDAQNSERSLYSMPLWGMRSKELQVDRLRGWSSVTTVEDHIGDGGFGSWLLEAANSRAIECKIEIEALSASIFGQVGSQETLNRLGGLA